MSGSSRTQVAIAGAGPVGCLLALMLARAGVKVSVLEAEPGLVQDLRASTFHPPTLDMLAPAGITRELIARGLITPKFQYRDREAGLVAEFDHAVLAGLTDHPYRLQCEQYKFTAVLVDMLSAYTEVDLRFNARVTALRQDCDGVTVTYGGRFGEGHIECDFLVGCDGSRSTVRKQLGVDFQGFTYPEHFVTASVAEAIDDIVPGMGHVAYIADPNEWCVLIHAPAFWRFLFPVPIEMSQAQALDDDYLQARLQRLAPYPGRFKVGHRTLYTVNQRVAQSYRAGRALLAGDAAHVNNPVGGMGMNGAFMMRSISPRSSSQSLSRGRVTISSMFMTGSGGPSRSNMCNASRSRTNV